MSTPFQFNLPTAPSHLSPALDPFATLSALVQGNPQNVMTQQNPINFFPSPQQQPQQLPLNPSNMVNEVDLAKNMYIRLADMAGERFKDLFYHAFDNGRDGILNMFHPLCTLVWEGNAVTSDRLPSLFKDLPRSKHTINSVDVQPIAADNYLGPVGALSVSVSGTVTWGNSLSAVQQEPHGFFHQFILERVLAPTSLNTPPKVFHYIVNASCRRRHLEDGFGAAPAKSIKMIKSGGGFGPRHQDSNQQNQNQNQNQNQSQYSNQNQNQNQYPNQNQNQNSYQGQQQGGQGQQGPRNNYSRQQSNRQGNNRNSYQQQDGQQGNNNSNSNYNNNNSNYNGNNNSNYNSNYQGRQGGGGNYNNNNNSNNSYQGRY